MKLTKKAIREAIKQIDIDTNNTLVKILFADCDHEYLIKKAFEQLKFASVSGLPITKEQVIDMIQVLVLALIKMGEQNGE